jgi:hypothetical protein
MNKRIHGKKLLKHKCKNGKSITNREIMKLLKMQTLTGLFGKELVRNFAN